jgi:GDP-L-fucose synthase
MTDTGFYNGKKILVAGGAGFVGANLIKHLLDLGADIRATLHQKPAVISNPEIEYLKIDLRKPEDCAKAIKGIDYVFMCAANTSGANVIENTPLVHVTPNVIMNALMLEAAYNAGVKKYLWLSSNIVYPAIDHPVKEGEMMSGPPFEKYFPAGWTKRFGEILCEIYSTKIKKPMTAIVVRPANIYGPYDDFEWETSHVVPALVRKTVERHDPIEVWGDGNDVKDLIYVDDFVEGILLAMEKIKNFDTINIGTGRAVTVKDVLKATLEAENYQNARIAFNTLKPKMIPFRLLDVSKAEKELDFKATTSLEQGIKKTAEWFKNNYLK